MPSTGWPASFDLPAEDARGGKLEAECLQHQQIAWDLIEDASAVAIFPGAEVLHVCHLHDGTDLLRKGRFFDALPLSALWECVGDMVNQQSLRYRLAF